MPTNLGDMENQDTAAARPTRVPPSTSADWPARTADTIEAAVAAAHDRLVRPLVIGARAVVFGIVIAVTALVLCVLLSIALVRLLDVYAFGGRAWASEALVGAVLSLGGLAAWSRRRPRRTGVES